MIVPNAHAQAQFLNVIDRDEAHRRFHAALRLDVLDEEPMSLDQSLGRVLARDVAAQVDVPSFDRSNFDGFAVRAADTFGADETKPRRLALLDQTIAASVEPTTPVIPGTAAAIATGGMLPRGGDAIVMVEHTDQEGDELLVRRAVSPGHGVSFAGTDIASGEIVLRCGTVLTSRDTGVLAAIGFNRVFVHRRPRVAVVSTGDEIVAPGAPMRPGMVYDSNARIIADAVRELGGESIELGIVRDDVDELRTRLATALGMCDMVLLSGGTSKGAGDLSYLVVSELNDPGIVAHGVALKPGKPICLAAHEGKAVVILPGFPTSAIFTFHEFAAPVIARLAGRPAPQHSRVRANLALKVNSEIGRTEYLLVGLIDRAHSPPNAQTGAASQSADEHVRLTAYPMGKGSGSVTTFSRADGFITIGRHSEIVEQGATVEVQLLGRDLAPADLVVIGSHCAGLDYLLGKLQEQGVCIKFMAVGSTAGLDAARRGECDLAGVHLLDPDTGQYNRPFLSPDVQLIEGYGRMQGIVFRQDDPRFAGRDRDAILETIKSDTECLMVNRNKGSGTRILIDRLLDGVQPTGYAVQARNHNAVAAAVSQNCADWGVAIESAAKHAGLGCLPLTREKYDFVMPASRASAPAVVAFRELLGDDKTRGNLTAMGFVLPT
ncbi:MAG: molybdopterin biosynthesis protein [Phycisphaeraceae bacterium]|jgi:putative molybdopterin biosynthesis protein|nr:molybdopterin biosynthesis protein [Phycisphaeraceae bacterium]